MGRTPKAQKEYSVAICVDSRFDPILNPSLSCVEPGLSRVP